MTLTETIERIRSELHQGADGTYWRTHRLPGERRYALSCNAPDSGAPGLSHAVNAALTLSGSTLRVVVADEGGGPWNDAADLQHGGVRALAPGEQLPPNL